MAKKIVNSKNKTKAKKDENLSAINEPELSFSEKVKAVVRKIPRGEVMTYGEIAGLVGSPRAARAVASVMAKNYDPTVPCHRVIRSDGKIGNYNRGGEKRKREILFEEGYLKSKD